MYVRSSRSLYGALAYTAGLVTGLVGFIAGVASPGRWQASRGGTFARRGRKSGNALADLPPARRAGGFHAVRASLVGRSKEQVADHFGSPPAAAMGPAAAAISTSAAGPTQAAHGTFWSANTWYYPFDPGRHTAIAVLFDHNRVVRVELIGGARA